MRNASGHRLQCKKEINGTSIKVFTLRKEKVTWHDEASRNRTEFFINNGTLKIISVEKEDSGQYTVQIHTSDGLHVTDVTFELYVKENLNFILITVCATLGAIALVGICCCCVFRRVKNRKKSGAAI
nr:natural killer cell receptor 2B4 isoform X2 [Salarias fasciatus]